MIPIKGRGYLPQPRHALGALPETGIDRIFKAAASESNAGLLWVAIKRPTIAR